MGVTTMFLQNVNYIKYYQHERAVSTEAALLLCKGVKGNNTESRKDF